MASRQIVGINQGLLLSAGSEAPDVILVHSYERLRQHDGDCRP